SATSTRTSRSEVPPDAEITRPLVSKATSPAPVSIDTDAGDCGTGGQAVPGSHGVATVSVTSSPSTMTISPDAAVRDWPRTGSGSSRSSATDLSVTFRPLTLADRDGSTTT